MKHKNNTFTNNIPVKWKIFAYFLLFAILLLVILWAYQVFFLESFYKSVKTSNLLEAADIIEQSIESKDLQQIVDNLANKNNLGIRITDFYFNDLYVDKVTESSIAHRLRISEMFVIYKKAYENGGDTYQNYKLSMNPAINQNGANESFKRGEPVPSDSKGLLQNLLYARLVTKNDGNVVMVLVDTIVTPLGATVKTLSMQLGRISVIMVIIALILAFVVSKLVATPIEIINNAAKELAHGKYNHNLNCHGYREISQLDKTLCLTSSELAKTERLRHELIANVSHDLRTPLTMIVGYGEVIRDIPGENTPENVQVIIDEAQRLTTLVNGLLDLSKLQSGIDTIQSSSYNFTQSVEEIVERYNKLLENRDFHFDFARTTEVYVNADCVKITQVIYNLVNNAVNYCGNNKNIVLRQIITGNTLRLEVTDRGEGISKEALPFIWDRYYKVDKTHQRAVVGTGLGLSIVKSILELHGANYGVESTVGMGSTFWFELKVL